MSTLATAAKLAWLACVCPVVVGGTAAVLKPQAAAKQLHRIANKISPSTARRAHPQPSFASTALPCPPVVLGGGPGGSFTGEGGYAFGGNLGGDTGSSRGGTSGADPWPAGDPGAGNGGGSGGGGDGSPVETPGLGAGPVAPSVVPEPATWALAIVGFGAIGTAMRRQRLERAV